MTVQPITQSESGYDVAEKPEVPKLRRRAVGLPGVLFLSVTGAAPMSAMLSNTPIAVGFGNGAHAPGSFVLASVILLVFCVGYVAMIRKFTASGGFYSFISRGLGREMGMASGLMAVVGYGICEATLCGAFSYFSGLQLATFGIHIAWPFFAIFMVVVISALTYFGVRLSAVILGVALVLEFVALFFFDIFMFVRLGSRVDFGDLNPLSFLSGLKSGKGLSAGVPVLAILFAFLSFIGFEAAANYAEETRNPKRTVPLALYISVILVGVFFVLTSWAGIIANGGDAIRVAQLNPGAFYIAPAATYVGEWDSQLMSWLIITSTFACGMAFHNNTCRYLYALGREGLLPRVLARTHIRWKSPFVASLVASTFTGLLVIGFAVFTGSNDPVTQAYGQLYGVLSVLLIVVVLSLQALVSLASLIYFVRHARPEVNWWRTWTAPILAFISQGAVLFLLLSNTSFVLGTYTWGAWLPPTAAIIFAGGLCAAFYLKTRHPQRYDTIGRLINTGV